MKRTDARSLESVLGRLLLLRVFLPLLLATLLAVFLVSYFQGWDLRARQLQQARSFASTADGFLNHAGRVLDGVARVAESSSDEALSAYMEATWSSYEYFDALYLLDPEANVRLLVPYDPRYLGLDMSGQPYSERVCTEGCLTISDPFISIRTGKPTLYLVRTLGDGGLVVGELVLEELQHVIVAGYERDAGGVYVVGPTGTLLAHSQFDRVEQQANVSGLPIFESGLGEDVSVYRSDGDLVLGTSSRVERAGWLVVVETPLWTVYGPGAITAVMVLLVGAVLISALVWSLEQQLERHVLAPLRQLGRGADALAEEDFERGGRLIALTDPPAEIGTLATALRSMAQQLHGLISGLEQRVIERTQDLRRRSVQLQVAAEVARDATAAHDLGGLLNRATDLIRSRFGFYHVGIFLADRRGEHAILKAAQGPAAAEMLGQEHRLEVGGVSIVGAVTATAEPRVALDVGTESVHFDNPLLPDTRSEMALPLRVGARVIGALDVQSRQEAAFDEDDVAVLQTLADQLAVAIERTRLFEQTQAALEERWRTVVRHLPVILFAIDPDGTVTLAEGKAMESIWEAPDELIGESIFDLDFIDPRIQSIVQRAMSGEAFSSMLELGDVVLEYWIAPLQDAAEAINGVIGVATDVTERVQAEEALREAEEQVRAFIESASDMIYFQRLDGSLSMLNAANVELTGYSVREFEENPHIWREIVHPDDQEIAEAFLDEHPDGAPSFEIVYRLQRKDGEWRWVHSRMVGAKDASGRYIGYNCIDRDITEQKRVEEALRRQTAQLEALRQVGLELTAELDLDSLLQSIVSRSISLLEATAGGIYLYRPEEDCLVWMTTIGPNMGPIGSTLRRGEGLSGRILETGEPITVNDYRSWEGRSPIYDDLSPAAIVGVPIRWGDKFLGVINVVDAPPRIFRQDDVDLLNLFANQAAIAIENARLYQQLQDYAGRLEEQVQARTAQVQAQYARLEAILQSIADGVVVVDTGGNVLQANPVAQRWLTRDLSPEDTDRLHRVIKALAARGDERPDSLLELKGLDLELKATPVIGSEIDPSSVVIDIHDVTYLKAMDRMRSRFVTNVSHELRTPVTVIKLYASLMERNPERWREYLDNLVQEANDQARLVENILQISRIDVGRLEMDPEPTSINTLVDETLAGYQELAASKGLTLQKRLLEFDPLALVDPDRMTQVLNNLVSNAIRYTPAGGKVTVSTGKTVVEQRVWVTLTVTDTGIGIPPDELPLIFDRFFRGEKPQRMQLPGTGLGLAIVREIVELHGGQVTVESQVEEGTTFSVRLPATDRRGLASGAGE
jgi:PAS domain S-box-containing protein